MTFISYNCFEETEDAYHTWLLETNQINLEEYKNLQEEMFELTEEDAEIVNAIYPSKTRAASSNVTVFGKMQWTDSSGKKHPLNEIRIEIWDDDPVEDDLITTVYTDSNGNFSSTFANDTSENGYDIYLKVIAPGRYVQVTYPSGNIHYGKITLGSNIANGSSLEASYTLLNSNTIGKAFQVQQAASMASNYVRQKTGSYLDTVYVRFPYSQNTSYFNNSHSIYISANDYCDWDVIQHEYGHYVASEYEFDASSGGTHSSSHNLADKLNSKSKGVRLAWSEGWATYFAISLQRNLNAISLDIPNVGDLKYTDTIDANLSYSLENCTTNLGEANEYAVASILWDAADGANESWDKLSLGYTKVFNNIKNNKCTTLSAFIKTIRGISNKQDLYIGNILQKVGVSATISSPTVGKTTSTSAPTFKWSRGGGSTKYPNNRFALIFYNSSYQKISEIYLGNVTSYTLTASQWNTIRNATTSNKKIYWVVKCAQATDPATGPYYSNYSYFYLP